MAGTKEGGLRAAKTIKKRYGADFYQRIGGGGGKKSGTGGFACTEVDVHGMTGKQRAILYGAKGGRISKRRPASYYK